MTKPSEQVQQELLSKIEQVDQQKLLNKIKQIDQQPKDHDERIIPHQAMISITAVINQQMPNGMWFPRSTFDDQFVLIVEGKSEKEVSDNLQNKLKELKDKWVENGGQIGRHKK